MSFTKRIMLCCCVFTAVGPAAVGASENEPFPLLLSPEQLAAKLDAVQLIDIRSETDFMARRIPGAIWVSAGAFRETRDGVPGMLPSQDALAELFSKSGIGMDTPVVVYGANNTEQDAIAVARAFWAFEYVGYPDVAILDGGLARWVAEEHAVASGPSDTQRTPVEVVPVPEAAKALADKADVVRALEENGATLVDARPAGQFTGATPVSSISRQGHIPGARNIYCLNAVTMPYAVYRDPTELEEVFYPDGISQDTEIVVYCNSGGFSSISYFVYRLLGHEKVANYDGSMIEWATDRSLPVNTGTP